MSEHQPSRLVRPHTLTAVCLIAASAAFLVPTASLPALSALMPAAMLIALLALSVAMLITDQRKAIAGEAAVPMTKAPKRVLGAFALIFLYAVSVQFIGFYISTAISIPLVTYLFGYRSPLRLGLATLIALAAIYLIFGFAMSQEFPTGLLWSL